METTTTVAKTKITPQDALDKVWDHFITCGNGPSFAYGRCLYNGPDGRLCAFAVVVPEAKRHLLVESRGAEHQLRIPEIAEEFALTDADVDAGFYIRLQGCHDDAADRPSFREGIELRLRRLASRFRLALPAGH